MKKKRNIPYGYTIKNGKTVVASQEAKILRSIYDRYINGDSLKDIANDLTKQAIPYTEKTTTWDKARISRILANPVYLGTSEYDPIIDEELYENAALCKEARQRNTSYADSETIRQIVNHVKCERCGAPMVRKVTAKNRIKQSWICQNPECGLRVRISDGLLLENLTILLNRIIANSQLLIPDRETQSADGSPTIDKLINEINTELGRQNPSEEYLLDKIREIAQERYRHSNSDKMLTLRMINRKAEMMSEQDEFNIDYFHTLIDYIMLGEQGHMTLYTKTDTNISSERRKDD